MLNKRYSNVVFVLMLILCAFPFITAPMALFAGIMLSMTLGNPFVSHTQKLTHKLLQFSVVGLGFGMNAAVALDAGRKGFIYTIAGITLTFILGYFISKVLKVNKTTSFLISAGTAICGGSAIAAVAPVIDAKSEDTSVALGVVFMLNSVALLLFPFIGHHLNLSQAQFGLWSAIAIHDTSSVVGASSQFGKLALATATTIKLTRALWIVPVTLISGFAFKSGVKKVKIPLFIIAFFIAMILNTYLVSFQGIFQVIYMISKQALVITLFLIGSNLSPEVLKKVGLRPFVLGITLWIIISTLSLLVV